MKRRLTPPVSAAPSSHAEFARSGREMLQGCQQNDAQAWPARTNGRARVRAMQFEANNRTKMSLLDKHSFSQDELLDCGHGKLFGPGNARLPLPPMLMFDRITEITSEGGAHNKGLVTAELDVTDDLWFFKCHFETDPVMPGCLGLDALWQLLGFHLAWLGNPGRGRALGVGEVKFTDQVLPNVSLVTYRLDVKRVISRRLVMGIADGTVLADGKAIYEAAGLRVGLFQM